jgi:hypothetical protein
VTPHGIRPGTAEYPLQVAATRLLGYRWPRQTGSSFMDCPAVPEPDEVDRSGLVDTDGIVPLPALAGGADAATRLRDLIRAVWGPDYGEGTIRNLLAAEDASANDLATWLADEFFDGHCRLFHQTPFVWQVWDGVSGGFSALVNYHRLCERQRRCIPATRKAPARRSLIEAPGSPSAKLSRTIIVTKVLSSLIFGPRPMDLAFPAGRYQDQSRDRWRVEKHRNRGRGTFWREATF